MLDIDETPFKTHQYLALQLVQAFEVEDEIR